MNKDYHRWAYSPTTADVTLSNNEEGHPANLRLHSDLADERPEKDLIFGYAIRTPQGYNIFDADHRSVEDPNMLWSIKNALDSGEL